MMGVEKRLWIVCGGMSMLNGVFHLENGKPESENPHLFHFSVANPVSCLVTAGEGHIFTQDRRETDGTAPLFLIFHRQRKSRCAKPRNGKMRLCDFLPQFFRRFSTLTGGIAGKNANARREAPERFAARRTRAKGEAVALCANAGMPRPNRPPRQSCYPKNPEAVCGTAQN